MKREITNGPSLTRHSNSEGGEDKCEKIPDCRKGVIRRESPVMVTVCLHGRRPTDVEENQLANTLRCFCNERERDDGQSTVCTNEYSTHFDGESIQ